jgi:hypothetical protein
VFANLSQWLRRGCCRFRRRQENAEIVNKLSTIDGIRLEYKVVLPRNYDPQKAYPAVLAFPPGGQDMDMSMRLSPAITARRPNSAATSW